MPDISHIARNSFSRLNSHLRLNAAKTGKEGTMGKRTVSANPVPRIEAIKPIEDLRNSIRQREDEDGKVVKIKLKDRKITTAIAYKANLLKILPSGIRNKLFGKRNALTFVIEKKMERKLIEEAAQAEKERQAQQARYNTAHPLVLNTIHDAMLLGDQDVKRRGASAIIKVLETKMAERIKDKQEVTKAFSAYVREKRVEVSKKIAIDMAAVLEEQSEVLTKLAEMPSDRDFLINYESTLRSVQEALINFGRVHGHKRYQAIERERLSVKEGRYDNLPTEQFIKKFSYLLGEYTEEYLDRLAMMESNPEELSAFRTRIYRLVEAKLTIDPPVLLDEQTALIVLLAQFKEGFSDDVYTAQNPDFVEQVKDFIFVEEKKVSKHPLLRQRVAELSELFTQKIRHIWQHEKALGPRKNYLLHNQLDSQLKPIKVKHQKELLVIDSEIEKLESVIEQLKRGGSLDVPASVAVDCAIDNLELLIGLTDRPQKMFMHWPVLLSNGLEALDKSLLMEPNDILSEVIVMLNQLIRDQSVYESDETSDPMVTVKFCLERLLEVQVAMKMDSELMRV